MERSDVLIIGGGPAGSTCATRLSSAGLEVRVIDKAEFPRDKTCAGWITPAVVQEVALDLIDYATTRTLQPITAFVTGIIGGKLIRTDYGRAVSYGIRRREFDHYLLAKSNARLSLGESIQSVERDRGAWIINDRYEAPWLVGAGGHFCPIARRLGNVPSAPEHTVFAQEIEFELNERQRISCRVDPDAPELYFCDDLKGYGWAFRKGDYLNVGLGREDREGLSRHVASFRQFLIDRGRVPADLPPTFRGHAYHVYGHSPRKLTGENVLLIGDAAGLAYALSGEGIRPAVESALMAADVILSANGAGASAQLLEYERRIQERFGARHPRERLPAFLQSLRVGVGRWLLGTEWFTRRVFLDHWFLHAETPALRPNDRSARVSVSPTAAQGVGADVTTPS